MAGPVFISHSSRDIEIARGICEAIEKRGVACWISGRDVGLGEHYGDAIVEAIERARAMVLVFSRNANHSEEIKKELALASKLGVAVFPVRIEETQPTGAFRYELMTRQWIDLFVDRDEAVKRLAEKIVALPAGAGEADTPPAPKSTPKPPPARRPGVLIGAAAAIAALLVAGAALWAHSGTGGEPAPKAAQAAVAPISAPSVTVAALEAPKARPAAELVAATEAASSPAAPNSPRPPPVRNVGNEPASPEGQADAPPPAAPKEKPTPRLVLLASLATGAAGVGDAASAPATLIAPPAPIAPKPTTEPPNLAEADGAKQIVRAALAVPTSSDPPASTPSPAPVADPSPPPVSAAPPAPSKPLIVASLATTAQPDKRPPADAAVKTFKDCDQCPEMVVVPAGSALVGSPPQETARMPHEAAPSEAVIPAPLAIGRYDVTFDEWEACVAAGGCNNWLPGDFGWGRGRQPVIFVSWNDAHAYVAWLSAKTGKGYRLLSETEWEYAARGCTTTACPNKPFWFGSIKPEIANYNSRYAYEGSPKGLSRRRAVAADEGPPNPFGLFNMLGNVRQWVEDCWSGDPGPAPGAAAPRLGGDCSERVTRGGSYDDKPQELRAAARSWQTAETRSQRIGFRVARALDP